MGTRTLQENLNGIALCNLAGRQRPQVDAAEVSGPERWIRDQPEGPRPESLFELVATVVGLGRYREQCRPDPDARSDRHVRGRKVKIEEQIIPGKRQRLP